MNVKQLRYIAFALVAAAFCSCQKDPSTSDLHRDYLVYTACDSGTDFSAIGTYFLPDSILIIGNSDQTEYWKDEDALQIIDVVENGMNNAGYTRTDDTEAHYALSLEVMLTNGSTKTFELDVTDQLADQPRGGVITVQGLEITDEEGGVGGGFDVDVGGWEDYIDIPVPL